MSYIRNLDSILRLPLNRLLENIGDSACPDTIIYYVSG